MMELHSNKQENHTFSKFIDFETTFISGLKQHKKKTTMS